MHVLDQTLESLRDSFLLRQDPCFTKITVPSCHLSRLSTVFDVNVTIFLSLSDEPFGRKCRWNHAHMQALDVHAHSIFFFSLKDLTNFFVHFNHCLYTPPRLSWNCSFLWSCQDGGINPNSFKGHTHTTCTILCSFGSLSKYDQ